MCPVYKCQTCGKIEHVENHHTPPCFKPTEVFWQCQTCKNPMGDLKIDPKASYAKAAGDRPVPTKPPVAGRVCRRLTEVQKGKDQEQEQAEAPATAMLKQQKQKQPQLPLLEAGFGLDDMVLDNAEDNAELQQHLHNEPDEVRHYQTIIEQDGLDMMQLLKGPGQQAKGAAAPKPASNALGEGTSTLPFNVPQYVADDDREKFPNPFSAKNPRADHISTLPEIVALLPSPSADRPPAFDYSKPAPPPDTSGLIDFGNSDDEDLKRFIGIGDDDDDDDYIMERANHCAYVTSVDIEVKYVPSDDAR